MSDAVSAAVSDGDSVCLAGFTHLIPFAAGHELIRQGRQELELIRATPDLVYDQLIAAGCARSVTYSWAGNPGMGSLPAFRRAFEDGVPIDIDIEEYTHFGLVSALHAGAANLPFVPLRTFTGSDLAAHNDNVATVASPFGDGDADSDAAGDGAGEEIHVVGPIEPDVTVVRAQRADEAGNAHHWGIAGEQTQAALAADTVVLSVEERCSEATIRSDPNRTLLTADDVDHVVVEPWGSHPSYAQGYYDRDDRAYRAWPERADTAADAEAWLDEWVYGVANRREYVEKLGAERILDLTPDSAYATPIDVGAY